MVKKIDKQINCDGNKISHIISTLQISESDISFAMSCTEKA